MAELKKKDWCTDKDPWRWERCCDCGTIIGKDYGSFSHMCSEKKARMDKLKKRKRKDAEDFKTKLAERDEWPMVFVDQDGKEKTRMVPIYNKKPCWMAEDSSFEAPYYVEVQKRLYVLSRSNSRVSFTGLSWAKYDEIVPEVVL